MRELVCLSMHRFYLPPEECAGAVVELTGREAHHALHVLRLRQGDRVQVLSGAGSILGCVVASASKQGLTLEVKESHTVPMPPYQITLLQAIPKGKLFEIILQKSTELGAWRIVPLLTERVITKLEPGDETNKTTRWRQVAVEAAKQCGSPWLPLIEEPLTPRQFLDRKEPVDLALFGSLQSNAQHPSHCFERFRREHHHQPQNIFVWIGPEGDFSPAEVGLLESADVAPVTLGPLVLRTETAALYCLSIVNYELQRGA